MIVCVCHHISDRDIAHAARHGCASYEELQEQLRIGTACGACGDCAQRTFNANFQRQPSVVSVAVSWIGRNAARAPSLTSMPRLTGQP